MTSMKVKSKLIEKKYYFVIKSCQWAKKRRKPFLLELMICLFSVTICLFACRIMEENPRSNAVIFDQYNFISRIFVFFELNFLLVFSPASFFNIIFFTGRLSSVFEFQNIPGFVIHMMHICAKFSVTHRFIFTITPYMSKFIFSCPIFLSFHV